MTGDMPDDRMLATLTRAAVLLFTESAATFLVPILIVAVVVGLVQTIMSVQESSLSFLPKLLTLVAVMAMAGAGVMRALGDFMISGLIDMVGAIR
ncbi:MAG: Bacterial export protein family 3 [Pseudomonadota bacterium]|jgi:flagellar biosynthetic protein FliQ